MSKPKNCLRPVCPRRAPRLIDKLPKYLNTPKQFPGKQTMTTYRLALWLANVPRLLSFSCCVLLEQHCILNTAFCIIKAVIFESRLLLKKLACSGCPQKVKPVLSSERRSPCSVPRLPLDLLPDRLGHEKSEITSEAVH